jgi:hypothetical protein
LPDLQVFVTDDRYSIPTLHMIFADSAGSVRELAERLLASSPHHLGVEVYEKDSRIFTLGAVATRGGPTPRRIDAVKSDELGPRVRRASAQSRSRIS